MRAPRKQAHHIAEWLTRDSPSLRGVVLGARREGKSDLLAQTHQLLFASAEGPLPFWFRFAPASDDAARARQAMRFAAAFCQQIRAFLLRQEELLAETPGELQMEIERPGLPLALSELAREILSAAQSSSNSAALVHLIALLPARFAHREGRPVCLLWDDGDALPATSPFFAALDSASNVADQRAPVCWLLTGLAPQMRRLLAERSFTAVPLQPFGASEALLMAEAACKRAGLRFNREVWKRWFMLAGTSPGWAAPLVEAAGLRGEPIESIEQLGRIYAAELESGSLGTWLAGRWPLPAPSRPAQDLAPQAIGTLLAGHAARSLAVDAPVDVKQPRVASAGEPRTADALDQHEWLRLRTFCAEDSLSPVESDWLRLETDRTSMGAARARARLLQEFLSRARRLESSAAHEAHAELGLDAIEEHLLFPQSPGSVIRSASGDELRLPEISSVVRESTPDGELFWSFGEAAVKSTKKSLATRATLPIILLIVHAEANPTKALVAEWARRLQQEVQRPNEPADSLRTELWVVVPAGGSLAPAGIEKRLSREMLANLLTAVETGPVAAPLPVTYIEPVSGGEASVEEIGRRLTELQARAQMLQQEFRSGQKMPTATSSVARPAPPPAGQASPADRRDEYLRQALSLSLMLASADLAATGSAADSQRSLGELQLQCQQVLDQLHAQANRDDAASSKVKPFPPSRV